MDRRLPFSVKSRLYKPNGNLGTPTSTKSFVSSMVKFEIEGENGVEYSSQWYPNLITNRFLNAFANKGFSPSNHIDSLREYLVIGASDSPKPEIKVFSGTVTGTCSTDTSGPTPVYYFTLDGGSTFFGDTVFASFDWNGGTDLYIPLTGEFARVLSKVNDSTIILDRPVKASGVTFELWNVVADLPSTDRVGASNQDAGSLSESFSYYSSDGVLRWVREIRRVFEVTGSDPIKFSSFALTETEPVSGSTNAMIYELVRDQYGAPTTITIAPGKRIKVYHVLAVSSPITSYQDVEVKNYGLDNSLTETTTISSTAKIEFDSANTRAPQEIFQRVLSPASDIFNGESDVVITLIALQKTGSSYVETTHTKDYTSITLLPYSDGSFLRSREFFISDTEFVDGTSPLTIDGFKFVVKKSGQTLFSVSFEFDSSITKDDLHEIKMYLTTKWFRQYQVMGM